MNTKRSFSFVLSLVIALAPSAAAMETDQYNLPPVPLADIGDEVSEYIQENLYAAAAKLNGEIAFHQSCVWVKTSGCSSAQKESIQLEYLRSNDALAKELYKRLGAGNIFVSHIGEWINSHEFRVSPARYKTNYLQSIYLAAPIDYATISPTVRLYGVEFGTDKLDHFFQQGYKYYNIQNKAVAHGKTPEQAEQKAVKWGQMTERTYFGLLVSGVYSNADLYANYAGMKFYQGLTQVISVGDKTRAPVLFLKDGNWTLDIENIRDDLIRTFITEHLNEAINPSGYAFTIFGSVRRAIKKTSCPEWRKAFPNAAKADLELRSASLEKWNGEDYGFTRKGKSIPVSSCFEN